MRTSASTRRVAALAWAALAGACNGATGPPGNDEPPGAVEHLTAQVQGGSVSLSWAAPAQGGAVESLIVRFPGTGVDAAPQRGRGYGPGDALGSGRAVYAGTATAATDAPPACHEYVYAAWARNGAGAWSAEPRTLRVTELASPPPPTEAPSALSATVAGPAVELAWSWATAGRADSVRVVRGTVPPASAAEGSAVYQGSGTSASDDLAALFPLEEWHFAAYACNACGGCGTAAARTSLTPTLTQSLVAGGYVIHWRHASADVCEDRLDLGTAAATSTPGWWLSCSTSCPPAGNATARQLSDEGHAESLAIGYALRARGVPFGRVVSSEYCRCTQTAEGMALGPAVETLPGITYFVYDEENRCAHTQALLAEVPAAGTNTALVGHANFTCPILQDLRWGEAAIFRPDGAGSWVFVDTVQAHAWEALP